MQIHLNKNAARFSAAPLPSLLALLLIAAPGFGVRPAAATPCEDKAVDAFKQCMADANTANTLKVKLCVNLGTSEDACKLQACTGRAESVQKECEGGDRGPSLRERLREALAPPPSPVEPEPAVQRCPAKDGLCYAVVLGATKCKVWRTMGRPLPPPFSYDGLSSEEYVDVDQCPKDLICEFYRSFGKGCPMDAPGR
jgi:hypothetical protein